MNRLSMMGGIAGAVVAAELAGWMLGFGPLVAAKAVMLGALVVFNCWKAPPPPERPPAVTHERLVAERFPVDRAVAQVIHPVGRYRASGLRF